MKPSLGQSRDRERSIIHLNIADFAAAVETNLTPSLAGYPLVIAPIDAPRAVVYDMNDQAYQEGIRKGMSLARIRRFNKGIKILPPRLNKYEQVMKHIFQRTLAYTPAIESGHWDGHIFMDITGTGRLFGPPPDIAFRLNKETKKDFGLDPIWAIATNKLVAKVATRLVKPAGEYIVEPGEEKAFLEPLPITLLPCLSRNEIIKLKTFNLSHISQIRSLTLEQLQVAFSHRASQIHGLVRGIDTSPVTQTWKKNASIRADHEFSDDTNDTEQLKKAIFPLVETICQSLRRRNMHGRFLSLRLSYSDGGQKMARTKLTPSTANEMVMFKKIIPLLFQAWTRRIRIRHLELICKNPVRPQIQTTLFTETSKTDNFEKVLQTMDRINTKFGKGVVKTALTLANRTHYSKNLATQATQATQTKT
ncbi:MAG: hypothetical protein PF503_04930 [Desulfobacula sp.]|jgi:DNA polymerase-4|nr:hypothetical protein [Desulfobacula sp.]